MMGLVCVHTMVIASAYQPYACPCQDRQESPCTWGDMLCGDAQDLQKRSTQGDEPAAAAPARPPADTRPLDDLLNFIEAGGRGADGTGGGGAKSKPRAKPKARPKQAAPSGCHAAGSAGNAAEGAGRGQGLGVWGRGGECEPSTSGRALSPHAAARADGEPGNPNPALDARGRAAGFSAGAPAANGSANGAAANGGSRPGACGAAPAAGQGAGPWAAGAALDGGASDSSTAGTADEWDASEEEAEEADPGAAQDRDADAQELSPRVDLDWVVRATRQTYTCRSLAAFFEGLLHSSSWLARACCMWPPRLRRPGVAFDHAGACSTHGWHLHVLSLEARYKHVHLICI